MGPIGTSSCTFIPRLSPSLWLSRTSACNFPMKPMKIRAAGRTKLDKIVSAPCPPKSRLPSMDARTSPGRTPAAAAFPASETAVTTMRPPRPPLSTSSSLGASPGWYHTSRAETPVWRFLRSHSVSSSMGDTVIVDCGLSPRTQKQATAPSLSSSDCSWAAAPVEVPFRCRLSVAGAAALLASAADALALLLPGRASGLLPLVAVELVALSCRGPPPCPAAVAPRLAVRPGPAVELDCGPLTFPSAWAVAGGPVSAPRCSGRSAWPSHSITAPRGSQGAWLLPFPTAGILSTAAACDDGPGIPTPVCKRRWDDETATDIGGLMAMPASGLWTAFASFMPSGWRTFPPPFVDVGGVSSMKSNSSSCKTPSPIPAMDWTAKGLSMFRNAASLGRYVI
mmetsp:Transcript_35647/g.83404  ORF Transcript_35647/g.83404 Transcript_35647/m.83404 type:complete len:395 (-) Transcript_35647:115-1299(-)